MLRNFEGVFRRIDNCMNYLCVGILKKCVEEIAMFSSEKEVRLAHLTNVIVVVINTNLRKQTEAFSQKRFVAK